MAADNHLVIMAGGVGSRLWPLSSPQFPKQFLDLLGSGKSLLQLTFDRFSPLIEPANTWVVTSEAYAPIVHEQLPLVPEGNILREPLARNTAPCIAYASWKIKSLNPKANIVVSPSDHLILDVEAFQKVIATSLKFVDESDSIVTLGMKPTRPETGYGYIQVDLSASCLRNKNIFRVDAFHEKPDLEMAKTYVADSNYFWNAGIFVWNVSTIVNALRIYAPEISQRFESLLGVYDTACEQQEVNKAYVACESISIDYAVLEKADEIFCYPASFGWSDLGSWRALYDNTEHDRFGNSLRGDVTAIDTQNCIIRTTEGKKVVVQGLDGYLVALKENALLICKLTDEGIIKTIDR
ncbi:MAG: mannose-1-phosphate guanylyltransferase [Prevotellaceae bacterium]|nr:mannose-1-phosphate guanylyltransferase [Prevotellaceae bacterium]